MDSLRTVCPPEAVPAGIYGGAILWNRNNIWWWGAAMLSAALAGVVFFNALSEMVRIWMEDENYGHGFFVPLISLYLIWLKRDRIRTLPIEGSWWGVPIVLVGVLLDALGEFGTLYILLQLSFWLVLVGLCFAALGRTIVREMAFPLFYLLTMIPLPQFLYQGLSGQLQLLSSALGVGCLQIVGVTVFREGNVIDLGPIQLQVVEACSGLRYLFPLMSLALLCSYLFRAPMWKRVTLFLSSMPIAILLNGFRIGVIGLLVEYFGGGAAEGFLHLFEGWVVFVLSLAILLLVMNGLSRIGAGQGRVAALLPASSREKPLPPEREIRPRFFAGPLPASWLCGIGLLAVLAVASPVLTGREELAVARQPMMDFPMQVERWRGQPFPLERQYIETLKFDDYLLADYRNAEGAPVNFYVAYYRSQRKGQSAHSPRTCIPGGGWEITSIRTVDVPLHEPDAGSLPVNRVVIQKGDAKQVVYYWFKQRERVLTNEYAVKASLVWDAIARNRTDGALIRLTAPVRSGQDEREADGLLQDFAGAVNPILTYYVPD